MDPHADKLLERIMTRIAQIRLFRRRVSMVSFGTLSLAAFAAIFPAWRELSTEAAHSGFWQYVAMLYHDPTFVATAWKDFAILLAESLPAFGIAALATSVITFAASVRSFVRVTT